MHLVSRVSIKKKHERMNVSSIVMTVFGFECITLRLNVQTQQLHLPLISVQLCCYNNPATTASSYTTQDSKVVLVTYCLAPLPLRHSKSTQHCHGDGVNHYLMSSFLSVVPVSVRTCPYVCLSGVRK